MTEHLRLAETSQATPEPTPRAHLATSPWLVLCPADVVEIRDPRPEALRAIPAGTAVVLLRDQPLSRRHLRRLARRAGIHIDRELVAVPSTRNPVVLVDETEHAVRHFWNDVVTVPPGLALASLPVSVVLRVARSLPWHWTGAVAPGRVLIGRRR